MSWDAIDELETDLHQIGLEHAALADSRNPEAAAIRILVLDKMLPYMRAEHQKLLDERTARRGDVWDLKKVIRTAANTIKRQFPRTARLLRREGEL